MPHAVSSFLKRFPLIVHSGQIQTVRHCGRLVSAKVSHIFFLALMPWGMRLPQQVQQVRSFVTMADRIMAIQLLAFLSCQRLRNCVNCTTAMGSRSSIRDSNLLALPAKLVAYSSPFSGCGTQEANIWR